jgi:serine kinase of HPr protein (carbohydrate metabolism regulator)
VSSATQIHATCVEVAGAGVLLLGASGTGKSDLALRLIDGGARLVADDRTDLLRREGELFASAPETIAGRIEVRGLGILTVPTVAEARVRLAIELVPPSQVERLPESRNREFLGVSVRLLALDPFAAASAAKVRIAARQLLGSAGAQQEAAHAG